MRTIQILAAALLLPVGLCAHADPGEDFATLLTEAWEWQLTEYPVFASRLGDRRRNDQWQDLSLAAFTRRHEDQQAFLRRLRAIDSAALTTDDQLNYDLFRRELENSIDAHQYKNYLMPMSQRGGVQSLESTAETVRLATVEDYEDWLARMAGVEKIIEQTMKLQEEGRKSGYMPPKILMERIPDQIGSQLVEDPGNSPFFIAFAEMPDAINETDQERLRQMAKDLIDESIVPAYRRFSRYFNDTYLPASRDSIGASSLPNGEAFYEYRTQSFTTTSMTPDEIHRLGLNEVKRIRGEMQLIIDDLEFDGDFADFLHFLRTDSQFYYDTSEELFDGYLAVSKRIDPELVKLFGRLPRIPYGLRPIPDNIAPDTTTAYYNQPAADGSRPGYYFPYTRPSRGITCKSRCKWNSRKHRSFANISTSPHSPKAGACIARASATNWDSIKTLTPISAH